MSIACKPMMQTPAKFSDKKVLLFQSVYQQLPGNSLKVGRKFYSNGSGRVLRSFGDRKKTINGAPLKSFNQYGAQSLSSSRLMKPMSIMESFSTTKRYNTSASSSTVSVVSNTLLNKKVPTKVSEASLQQALFEKFRRNVEPQLRADSHWANMKVVSPKTRKGIEPNFMNKLQVNPPSRTHSQWTSAESPSLLPKISKTVRWPIPQGKSKEQTQQSKFKSTSERSSYVKVPKAPEADVGKLKEKTISNSHLQALQHLMDQEVNFESKIGLSKPMFPVEKKGSFSNSNKDVEPVQFENKLMHFNKSVKKLISLGPRRNINFQPKRSSESDPLLGWKHPTKLDILTQDDTHMYPTKDRHLAQAMAKKSTKFKIQLEPDHARLIVKQAENNKWYKINRSKPFDLSDRSEVARQQKKYIQQRTLYQTSSKPSDIVDVAAVDTDQEKDASNSVDSIEPLPEQGSRSLKAQQPIDSSKSQANPGGESSCSYLAKSLRDSGRYIDNITDSSAAMRHEMHRKQHMQHKLMYNKTNHPYNLMNLNDDTYVFKVDNETHVVAKPSKLDEPDLKVNENLAEMEVPRSFRSDVDMKVDLKYPIGTTLEQIVKKSNQTQAFLVSPKKY